MKSFAFLLLLGVAAALPSTMPEIGLVRKFHIYGSPLDHMQRDIHHDVYTGLRHDVHDATYLYDHPLVMIAKTGEKNDELAAVFVEKGLNSLLHFPEGRFLHEMLRSDDQVGIIVDSNKFLHLPQWDMPLKKFLIPEGLTLARYASIKSDFHSVPWLLMINKHELKSVDMERLVKIAEYDVYDHFVKVSRVLDPFVHKDDQALLTRRGTEDIYSHVPSGIVNPYFRAESTYPYSLYEYNPLHLSHPLRSSEHRTLHSDIHNIRHHPIYL